MREQRGYGAGQESDPDKWGTYYLGASELEPPYMFSRGFIMLRQRRDNRLHKITVKTSSHGVGEADLGMKVRYRKRDRNPHECHIVLKLKPVVCKQHITTY